MSIHPGVKKGGDIPAPLLPAMSYILKLAARKKWKVSKVRSTLHE